MKKILTIYLMIATSFAIYAQGIPDPSNEAAGSIGFIQNVGQVINTDNNQVTDIKYHTIHATPKSYYQNNKINFVYAKFAKDTINNDTLARLDMSWIADGYGNTSTPSVYETTDEKVNYYLAHCNSGCDQLNKFSGLIYENIYNNIDMRMYSNNVGYKIYFVVRPGGNPQHLRMLFDGQTSLDVSQDLLTINIGGNSFSLPGGIAYEYDATGTSVLPWTPQFNLNANGTVEVTGGAYNTNKTLVYELAGLAKGGTDMKNIDWSTSFGGSGDDEFYDVDINTDGSPHVTGWSNSDDFPITTGSMPFKSNADIVIVKFKQNLAIDWSTYYGGSEDDGYNSLQKFGISLDNQNNTFISAITGSIDIPLKNANPSSTSDYFDDENNGGNIDINKDQILARFNTIGQLTWGTYFGGDEPISISPQNGDIIVDKSNNAIYMTAFDASPPLLDAGSPAYYEGARTGSVNAGTYIAKFNSNLELQWCTYLGNLPALPFIQSLEIDNQNRLLMTGSVSEGSGFPKTTLTGAYNQNFGGGGFDNFIVRFNTNLSINWATYIGEANTDIGHTIITTSNDKIVILGLTYPDAGTSLFPIYKTTATDVFNQPSFGGQDYDFGDASICTFNFNGKQENFTYLGGSEGESYCFAASSSSSGNIFIGGSSNSTDFPKPATANLSTNLFVGPRFTEIPPNNFETDAMIFGLDQNFVSKWSTVFGTRGIDRFWASATYGNYVYYVGSTYGENFPMTYTGDAYHSYSNGSKDAVILRANMSSTPLNVSNIENKNLNNVSIYPNPAKNKINFSKVSIIKEVSIFDLVGNLVMKVKVETQQIDNFEIDISNLYKGIYIIETTDSNDIKSKIKLIKE